MDILKYGINLLVLDLSDTAGLPNALKERALDPQQVVLPHLRKLSVYGRKVFPQFILPTLIELELSYLKLSLKDLSTLLQNSPLILSLTLANVSNPDESQQGWESCDYLSPLS